MSCTLSEAIIAQHVVVAQHSTDSQKAGSTCHAATHLDPGASGKVGCANLAWLGCSNLCRLILLLPYQQDCKNMLTCLTYIVGSRGSSHEHVLLQD